MVNNLIFCAGVRVRCSAAASEKARDVVYSDPALQKAYEVGYKVYKRCK